MWEGYPATFALTFDQTVSITESFYPNLSLSKLFANLGGSLGLWLGIGLLQICFYAIDLLQYIKYAVEFK